MASRAPLDVWLYDSLIGRLTEPKYGKLRFDFNPAAEERFRVGSPVLSTSMPVDVSRRPRGDVVRSYFDALLPEGRARDSVFARFSVTYGDSYGLLSAIGRDCAGAVVLQPAGSPPPSSVGSLEPLAADDLAALVANLPERPFGADERVRASLAGAQEKLLLAKTPEGEWARAVDGAPTTFILKPQDMRFDGYAAGEALCLRLAKALGLTTVDAEVFMVGDRPTIAVSRYDRAVTPASTTRIHQEDACQALGVDCGTHPDRKYQARGGPSLRDFASLLADFGSPADRPRLLALTTLNIAVGNADQHARNLSLLHPPDGTTELAPAYDITPITYYVEIPTEQGLRPADDELGMWVNYVRSVHDVTLTDLVYEGLSWGITEAQATRTVRDTISAIAHTLPGVARRVPVPKEMANFIEARTAALATGRRAGEAIQVTRPPSRRRTTGLRTSLGRWPTAGQDQSLLRSPTDGLDSPPHSVD